MALYAAQVNASKRQKTNMRDSTVRSNVETGDHITGLPKIEYKPNAAIDDPFCFHYYNANEKVHGRTMEEWLRVSVSFLHVFQSSVYQHGRFDPVIRNNYVRQWDEGIVSLDNYKRRLRLAFDFYSKLGVKYWSVYDRDLAPEGDTVEETEQNLNEMVELAIELQQRTNIKLLWMAANLHYSSRYVNGACTTPETQVLSYTGIQLKKAIEVAHRLGAESFLFHGSREGYSSPLNTDHMKQVKSYAHILKMCAEYKDRIGYRGQLLFEPNYEDTYNTSTNLPTYDFNFSKSYYRYDYDTPSAICFLKHYGLDKLGFKISTRPGQQMILAIIYGMLGSIDSTSIYFPPTTRETTMLMKSIIEHGSLQPGGINIGLSLRPEPVELKDLLVAYITCIDIYAKGLRIASKLIADGSFAKNLQQRYLGFHSGFGNRVINGDASLEECEEQIKKINQTADVLQGSAHSQHWESVFTRYCMSTN